MNMTIHLEPGWVNAILPELILSAWGMLLILWDAFLPKMRAATASLAIIGFIITGWSQLLEANGHFFGGTYEISDITRLFDFTFIVAAILASLFAREYLQREGIESGEFYALLMWGTVGMMMMA